MQEPKSSFWHDPSLPHLEVRIVQDGQDLCYSRHSHAGFSIGTITGGRSVYQHERGSETVETGAVVIMNPEEVHACNPHGDDTDHAWAYRMLYVDASWLGQLQKELGTGDGSFQGFAARTTRDQDIYTGLNELIDILMADEATLLQKQENCVAFFGLLQARLGNVAAPEAADHPRLKLAAQYIDAHCRQALSLDNICNASNLSPSYLIRAFKQRYGMTPHAYQVNRRIQYARERLKAGDAIAAVALDAGFSDQAHFQRAFKQHLAATPGHYTINRKQ
jgi:AraC-like DNA-binding protein